jgi:hypothetical protein
MSEEAAREWHDLCVAFARYLAHLDRVKSVHVNSAQLREETKQLGQRYFRRVRPSLGRLPIDAELATLNASFQNLLQLSEGRSTTASYRKNAKRVRKVLPRVTGQIEVHIGDAKSDGSGPTQDDLNIITTLTGLVPSAAQSYQQAIADLADPRRVSFRGPALELRETLREVLDHLAPDDAVMKAPGFKMEIGRPKPTMKQKVRFILRARDMNKTESAVPEDATTTIEGMIGELTRSIYDRGSLVTHVAKERRSVIQLKRYVDVVFHDILEL